MRKGKLCSAFREYCIAKYRSAVPGRSCPAGLLEVEQDVHRARIRIGAQPVAGLFVVNREFAENFSTPFFKLDEKLLEVVSVEDFSPQQVPGLAQLVFAGERDSGEDQLAHAIRRAFSDGGAIDDPLRRLVEQWLRLELHFDIAAAAVFVLHAGPGRGDLDPIGDFTGLQAEKLIKRRGPKCRYTGPLDAAEAIDRAWLDRHNDKHAVGQRAVGVAGEPGHRRAEAHPQATLFE